jgi:hypothetical protein
MEMLRGGVSLRPATLAITNNKNCEVTQSFPAVHCPNPWLKARNNIGKYDVEDRITRSNRDCRRKSTRTIAVGNRKIVGIKTPR